MRPSGPIRLIRIPCVGGSDGFEQPEAALGAIHSRARDGVRNSRTEGRCDPDESVVQNGDGLHVVSARESGMDLRGLDGGLDLERANTLHPGRSGVA